MVLTGSKLRYRTSVWILLTNNGIYCLSNFSFIFYSTQCGNYQMLTSVVRVEVSDVRFLVSQLTVRGYLGMKIVKC